MIPLQYLHCYDFLINFQKFSGNINFIPVNEERCHSERFAK